MIRRVPLKRSYMRRSPARRIARETPEETVYKDWLHTQPCIVTGHVGERVQASHVGSGGMGQKKGTWFYAVPMRDDVHRDWEGHCGQFTGWSREERRGFADAWVALTQARWTVRKKDYGF